MTGRLKTARRTLLALAIGLSAAGPATLAGTAASADDRPDWLPEALEMPPDVEVRIDRKVGSYIRMFSFSTTSDGPELLAEWQVAMEDAGYSVTEPQEMMENVFEFTGRGVQNGKVALLPGAAEGTSLVEVDITLQ